MLQHRVCRSSSTSTLLVLGEHLSSALDRIDELEKKADRQTGENADGAPRENIPERHFKTPYLPALPSTSRANRSALRRLWFSWNSGSA